MLVHVQIQQELDHRPLQTRPPAGVQQKATASQLCAALKVDQLQRITQIQMAFWLKIECRLIPVYLDFFIG